MKHVHAGSCPLCGRDYYLIVYPSPDPNSLGTFVMYHLEIPCDLFEAL